MSAPEAFVLRTEQLDDQIWADLRMVALDQLAEVGQVMAALPTELNVEEVQDLVSRSSKIITVWNHQNPMCSLILLKQSAD